MPPTLPTPPTFLTTLLSALPSHSTTSQPIPTSPHQAHTSTSTLQPHLPISLKPLILLLHSIYPRYLLPALDLLDRRLLLRLDLSYSTIRDETAVPRVGERVYYVRSGQISSFSRRSGAGFGNEGDSGMKGGERDGGRGDGGRELGKGEGGRETGTTPGPGTYYEVRLNAWNCSCPAFTVSSFSSSTSYITSTSHTTHTTSTSHTSHTAHTNHTTTSPFHPPKTEENGKPSFGGFRRGKDERLPPICKHLLACLLSEWSGRDGVFEWGVHCRKVSRDEMAGWAGGWRE